MLWAVPFPPSKGERPSIQGKSGGMFVMAYWWLVPFVFLAPKKEKNNTILLFLYEVLTVFSLLASQGFFFFCSGFDHKMKGIYTERLGGGIGANWVG